MAEDVLKKQEMYTERMEKLMQKANAMMLLSKTEERREGLSILRQESKRVKVNIFVIYLSICIIRVSSLFIY